MWVGENGRTLEGKRLVGKRDIYGGNLFGECNSDLFILNLTEVREMIPKIISVSERLNFRVYYLFFEN